MFKRSLFFVVALAVLNAGCGWWGGGGGRHYEGHREYHHDHDRR